MHVLKKIAAKNDGLDGHLLYSLIFITIILIVINSYYINIYNFHHVLSSLLMVHKSVNK